MFVDDLVFLFESAGLAVSAVSLFEGHNAEIPVGDGPFITIVETSGAGIEGTHNSPSVPAYVWPGAEFIFTASDKADARAKAEAVYLLLYPIRNRFVNGTWWREVHLLQEPHDLNPDDVGRSRVAFSMVCCKRFSPATS